MQSVSALEASGLRLPGFAMALHLASQKTKSSAFRTSLIARATPRLVLGVQARGPSDRGPAKGVQRSRQRETGLRPTATKEPSTNDNNYYNYYRHDYDYYYNY